MKRSSFFVGISLFAFLVLFSSGSTVMAQGKVETLTNDEVIAMLNAGLSTTVIVNKIRTSRTNFDLSTSQLIRLKQAGLNDDILQAMQGYSDNTDARQAQSPSVSQQPPVSPVGAESERWDENDPKVRHDVGIYVYSEHDGKSKMTEMEPSVSTQSRTGGTFGNSVTYGLWPTKNKARIPGVTSNFDLTAPQPTFYFYLNEKDRTMQAVKYFPASVNQFQLVKFSIKGKAREVTVGRTDAFGSKTGIHDDNIVEFSYEKVGDGVFKITPKKALKPGEYGFYLIGAGGTVGATFYDFTIKAAP